MPTYEAGDVLDGIELERTGEAYGLLEHGYGTVGGLDIGDVIQTAIAPADSYYAPPNPTTGQLWPLEITRKEMIQIYSPVAIGDITGLSAALAGLAPKGFTGNEVVEYEAGTELQVYRVTVINSLSKAIYAEPSINEHAHKIIGVTITGAAGAGEMVQIRNYGQIEYAGWSWAADAPIYLGDDGTLTQTAPTSGARVQVAFPIASNRMFIDIKAPVFLDGEGSWNYNESPAGLINGFNNIFTTANEFVTGKTIVYLNGLRQSLGTDYAETASDQITFATAPSPSDTIVMDYLAV